VIRSAARTIDSRDVLQEAYLAAHRDFDRFEWRDEGAFLRWLFRIVDRRPLPSRRGSRSCWSEPL
jgi:DNA-directed RNA polymerase specialized sigma24 family protein